jgi:hypothetical protein
MIRYPLQSEAVSTVPRLPDDLLVAALRYARAGWPVFPCQPNGTPAPRWKAPLTEHGFRDATTDPAVVRAWWTRWPRANVAIATGVPGPDVLDVDVKAAGNGFPALGTLKRAGVLTGAAVLVRTRSGGIHVYYAGTAQGCHALPRHCLDFKSRGGYVLAPPSRVGGRPYELLDHRAGAVTLDWPRVAAILIPPRAPRHDRPRPALPPGELPPGVRRALEAPVDDRSVALHRLVGACVRAGLDDPAIHEIAAGYEPAVAKYGERLHAEIERSITKIGTT